MNQPTWLRVKDVFHQALARPPAGRKAFVREQCAGDAELCAEVEELCAEVEELLDAHEAAAAAGPEADGARSGDGEVTGTMIGPYKLLQRIGEGGFGVVYMAEQTAPVSRMVALKVIKLGMDTKQVIARFEAERQALALMDHPNIARVLDAGATAIGRPYFVMELVKGVPITHYCDANHLTTRQRLELFVSVCHAVRHAHQKGVIHRDLKPSNVLVTLHDGRPVPKVIDFGIAKATGARLTDKTLFTEFKQFMGTPEYMSPEQAEMSGLDVDTRADIYSLGVLLYELLTGTTPIDPKSLRTAAYDEMMRLIRDVEPPRPSTRVSTLGASVAEVAKHRRSDPSLLKKHLLGDLDWIVMKALEKDRTRRYDSADGFAQDIERHLRDEPVLASPPSPLYKLRKFARRNRAALGALGAIAAALVLGLSAATWGWVHARHERDRALVAQQTAGRQAERTAKINTFLQGFLRAPSASWLHDPKKDGPLRRPDVQVVQLVDELVGSLDAAPSGDPDIEAEIRFAVAESYLGLSRYADAERQARRALELRRQAVGADDLVSMRGLQTLGDALQWQGRFAEAKASLLHSIDGCRRLAGEEAEPTRAAELAYLTFAMSRPEPEAVPRARRLVDLERRLRGPDAVETLGAQAVLAFALGSARLEEEADAVARRTLADVERALGIDVPLYEFLECILGNVALHLGDAKAAEAWFRSIIESAGKRGEQDLFLSSVASCNLGMALEDQERWSEAEAQYRQASETFARLFGEDTVYTLSTRQLLAGVLCSQGRNAEADAAFRDVIDRFARAVDLEHRSSRDDARQRFVAHLLETERFDEAEAVARAGVELARPPWVREPGDLPAAGGLVLALCQWSETLDKIGKDEEARATVREACAIAEKGLVDDGSAAIDLLPRVARHLQKVDLWPEAEAIQRHVLDVHRRELGSQDLRTLEALNALAWNLYRQGRHGEAEPLADECVAALRAHPYAGKERLGNPLGTLACARLALGRAEDAEPLFVEALDLEPDDEETMIRHAGCLIELGRLDEAEPLVARALELDPDDEWVREQARRTTERLAELRGAKDGNR